MRILVYIQRFLAYLLGLVDRRIDNRPQLPETTSPPASEPAQTLGNRAVSGDIPPDEQAQMPNSGSTNPATTIPSREPSVEDPPPTTLPVAASVVVDPSDAASATSPVRVVVSEPGVADTAVVVKLDVATAAVPVRRFFARIIARGSSPSESQSWPLMPVERFFLSVTQPTLRVLRGRGNALVDPQTVGDAFSDFVWD